jgi:hypothetical protein
VLRESKAVLIRLRKHNRMQHVKNILKRWWISTGLHGVTTQKRKIFDVATAITSKLTGNLMSINTSKVTPI